MTHREAVEWFTNNSGPDVVPISDSRRLACGLPMSARHYGRGGGGGRKAIAPPRRMVEQLDSKGQRVAVFLDAVEAYAWTGVDSGKIEKACASGGVRIGKSTWRFAS